MAKKFKFRLESVLRYRKIIEDERKREFALANREVEEVKAHADTLQNERMDMQEDVREMLQSPGMNFDHVINSMRYVGNLDMTIAQTRQQEMQLRAQMEGKRQAFVESRRDKRALEILKDNRKETYEKEVERDRQKILDELSLRLLKKRREDELRREMDKG